MDENRIVITYETIFELLRREKEREALQKLENTFLEDVLGYLKERKSIIKEQESKLIDPEEKKRNEKQFENTKKIVREFYEKRERKIISLAVDKIMIGNGAVDTTNLLHEEMLLFQRLVNLLNEHRANVLNKLLNLETQKPEETTEKTSNTIENNAAKEEEKTVLMVRFVHAVPKFVGKEIEEYGPFEEEEIANLPREIANVLIGKGRAEEIKES